MKKVQSHFEIKASKLKLQRQGLSSKHFWRGISSWCQQMLNFELVSTNAGDAASCLGDELVHRRRGDAAAAAVDPEELPVRGELGDRAQAGGGHGGAVGEVDLRRPGRGASAFLT